MAERRTRRNRIAIESVFGPEGEAAKRIRLAILMLSGIIFVGTAGYMSLGWDILDALYMTVITVGTIGFEEVRDLDESVAGRLWTIVLIISGVAVLGYATTSLVALAVEGTVRDYFRSRRMRAEIGKLSGHQIICGYGRVGRQVAEEFALDGVLFVVIDQDPDLIEDCLGHGYPALLGEASDDETLQEAGISKARGLVAAVDSDAENVFVVLSARNLNPKLHIVARTSSDASASKLQIAGADRTISPYSVGGRRLASLATQPVVVDFLDIVTRGEKGIEFRLEEFGVPKESPFANHTIADLKIGEKTGAIVLAIRTPEGNFDTTPSAQDMVHPGDTLIVLGTREQVTRLESLMAGVEPFGEGPCKA